MHNWDAPDLQKSNIPTKREVDIVLAQSILAQSISPFADSLGEEERERFSDAHLFFACIAILFALLNVQFSFSDRL
jgi:hypothetical protein